MRILVAGDTHGNTEFLTQYLYPKAADLDADAIVQVGDFGFWEHVAEGVEFLDAVEQAAKDNRDIPLLFVRGNHDNLAFLLQRYGQHRTGVGFIEVRPNVLHIPDGLVWTWEGHTLRAFGGAYSVDKQYRLDLEAKRNRYAAARADARVNQGLPAEPVQDHRGTLWFPEEELTDEQMDALLAEYSGPVDVIFSHDKPSSANPGLLLKNIPQCRWNQLRLQRAVVAHQPSIWIHGHLHHYYTDTVRSGDDNAVTQVVGLSCDDRAAMSFWKPWHSFCVLDLEPGKAPRMIPGQLCDEDHDPKRGQLAPLARGEAA